MSRKAFIAAVLLCDNSDMQTAFNYAPFRQNFRHCHAFVSMFVALPFCLILSISFTAVSMSLDVCVLRTSASVLNKDVYVCRPYVY